MRLEDKLNEARRNFQLPGGINGAFEKVLEAIQIAAGGSPSIFNARKAIIDALNEDLDLRRTYVDNIAAVIMDFDKELVRDKERAPLSYEDRQVLAERILNHILG